MSMAERRFFQEAARTGKFSSSEYAMAKIAKKPVITFGYPVKNAAHKLVGVIGVVLDLGYIHHMFEHLSLPPGSLFALVDHRGTILMRSPNDPLSKGLVGSHDIGQNSLPR